ncbi:LOW QUALITY PROTEIN: hypothetical protein PHMEG_00027988 [Phytophthora megakarya]|uniref:Uncharacterized protein n=1 Tax=Phytophthora megakarya TaxID=4795 RepID=A0A225V5Y8_9STRA|nr:LOW QUALITY PROTEIN: hypothetical protein PHMEG_00027988 [Phytophthora megakarya]
MSMVCDSISAYCHRFEVSVGKREASDRDQADTNTGAVAVARNMKIIMNDHRKGFRLVVIDRFKLVSTSRYPPPGNESGTVQIDRIGRITGLKKIERGVFTFSRVALVPCMIDKEPVPYLTTDPVITEKSVNRNVKGVGPSTCPKLVSDYQSWIGGVDVHDQLRLQLYSIQTAFRF